jgi:ammonia channel protein AmtB
MANEMQGFLMVPGISLVYSGVSDRKISLSMAWLPLMTAALVGLQVGG